MSLLTIHRRPIKHVLKGVLHLLPKISMFCAPSQNNQRLEKEHMHLIVNCSRNSKMALKIQKVKRYFFLFFNFFKVIDQNGQNVVWILSYRSKQSKCCLDQ